MYEKTIGRPERDPFDALVDVLTAVNRYDLLLAIVPVVFAVALVGAGVFGVSLEAAMVVAAIVGVVVIVDACYLNPPTGQGSTERSYRPSTVRRTERVSDTGDDDRRQ
ncbi:hypothetical protein [Natrialba sp. INN-245]|uniref:hypothetical protein n=1 Tax=Natrialba sp. INN-245 TaxID=2690967 RepID=UPI001F2B5FF5|nr:hypothetical protein [Natrialba sp. INN-245]